MDIAEIPKSHLVLVFRGFTILFTIGFGIWFWFTSWGFVIGILSNIKQI